MSRKHHRWYRAFRWGDLVVALVIVAVAAILLGTTAWSGRKEVISVVLTHEGRLVRTWDLDELNKEGQVSLELGGFHYRLEWADGKIRFAESDCPDKICVQTGWVGKKGSIAACVPGGVVLKVKAGTQAVEGDDVDVVIR